MDKKPPRQSPIGTPPPGQLPKKTQTPAPEGTPPPGQLPQTTSKPSPPGTPTSGEIIKTPPRPSPSGTPPPGRLPPKHIPGLSPQIITKTVKPFTPKPRKTVYEPLKPKKKISILYVISTTRIGGSETALKRLLRNLDPDHYNTEVLVTGEKGPLDGEYRMFSGSINYLEEQDLETVLKKRAKTGKYDYIHFFNLFKIYDMLPAIRQENPQLRIVSSIMANPDMFKDVWNDQYKTIRKNEVHLYAQIVDSDYTKKMFPEATTIKNGVNLETFSPTTKKTPRTIAWVGRISTSKKARLIPQIAKRLPDYQFTMIGGEKTDEYQEIMTHPGLKPPKNLEILIGLGERQVADKLAESQYLLFTSHGESLPISVLEAMASECCVVAQPVGDLPHLIQNNVNGHLIPSGAELLVWVPENLPKLKIDVGEAARRRIISEHNIDNTVKQHEFLYEAVGSHHNQTRIAFLWGYQSSYASRYWESKIDSLQHAIATLSKNNVVQVYVSIAENTHRKIILGQNVVFLNKDTGNIIQELRRFRPHMIFMNMFHEKKWVKVINAFPNVWKALMHYGSQNLKVPYAKNLDAVLVQMEYLRSKVAEANDIPIEKVHKFPFCVEQWLFKPTSTNKEYTGVMLADFRDKVKRQHLLIQAWKDIPGKLLLIGRFERSIPKDYHQTCISQANRLGISDRITFKNGVPHAQLPEILNKAKIGFLTSKHEGGSRALKEMIACGLPCIVLSDCDGNVNMIKDGVDGLVAEPRAESIAEKTQQLLGKYVAMGKAGSERIRATFPYHHMYTVLKLMVINARPEVSILTTSMNYGKYIDETICSVINLKTTFPVRVNHIVMDGGSTDDTLNTLMKHRRSIYYYIRRDTGQTSALNQAMKFVEQQHPQTSYIGWINADDYYLSHWLQDSLSHLQKEPPATAMVYSDMRRIGDYTGVIHQVNTPYISPHEVANRGNLIGQPTVLIRLNHFRELRNRSGYWFEPNTHYVQDLELWFRFFQNNYLIAKLPRTNATICLRAHKLQMSRTHLNEQTKERDQVMRELARMTETQNPIWIDAK